jgi:hypothetical protein
LCRKLRNRQNKPIHAIHAVRPVAVVEVGVEDAGPVAEGTTTPRTNNPTLNKPLPMKPTAPIMALVANRLISTTIVTSWTCGRLKLHIYKKTVATQPTTNVSSWIPDPPWT